MDFGLGFDPKIFSFNNRESYFILSVVFGSNQGLKVFDCYRPMKAVDYFVRWAEDLEDTEQKQAYYPDIAKMDLFKKGYIGKAVKFLFLAQ